MKLSVTNIIGVIFSMGMVAIGITETIGTTSYFDLIPALSQYTFLNFPSLFIVLGGVLNAVFITYQPRYVGKAFLSIFYLFSQGKFNNRMLKQDLQNILRWNEEIRQKRVQALNNLQEEQNKEISGYLFSLIGTNYSNEEIREFGASNIEETYYHNMVVVEVLRSMGAAAPSFGMFGTLIGLVIMLGELQNPSAMGPGLATALITTLYGVSLARFIFYPIAEKLKNAAQMNMFRDQFIMEGILLINQKKSSFFIKDKLSAYLINDFNQQEEELNTSGVMGASVAG